MDSPPDFTLTSTVLPPGLGDNSLNCLSYLVWCTLSRLPALIPILPWAHPVAYGDLSEPHEGSLGSMMLRSHSLCQDPFAALRWASCHACVLGPQCSLSLAL